MRVISLLAAPALVLVLGACGAPEPPPPPVSVFAAASLARPVAVVADTFASRSGAQALLELGGSLDLVRRVTDLQRVPDVLLLADDAVMAALVPGHLDWYVRFATSPIVIAYREGSRFAADITAESWATVLARPDVRIGRADSAIAPAGRHALQVLRRADAYYGLPDLAARLLENAGPRYVRPNATELAALLEAGEVDYILDYEAVARQYGFRHLSLPSDLAVSVLYGATIPRAAANPEGGVAFLSLLLSSEGRRLLRDQHVEPLRMPVAVGDNVPAAIADLVRTLATTAP